MPGDEGQAPTPRRRKSDFAAPAEQPLRSVMQLLAARQLVDIWLSEMALAGIFVLMLVLCLASLRSAWQVPIQVYAAIAIVGVVLSFVGLVGSAVLWLWADRRTRAHDG